MSTSLAPGGGHTTRTGFPLTVNIAISSHPPVPPAHTMCTSLALGGASIGFPAGKPFFVKRIFISWPGGRVRSYAVLRGPVQFKKMEKHRWCPGEIKLFTYLYINIFNNTISQQWYFGSPDFQFVLAQQ